MTRAENAQDFEGTSENTKVVRTISNRVWRARLQAAGGLAVTEI